MEITKVCLKHLLDTARKSSCLYIIYNHLFVPNYFLEKRLNKDKLKEQKEKVDCTGWEMAEPLRYHYIFFWMVFIKSSFYVLQSCTCKLPRWSLQIKWSNVNGHNVEVITDLTHAPDGWAKDANKIRTTFLIWLNFWLSFMVVFPI